MLETPGWEAVALCEGWLTLAETFERVAIAEEGGAGVGGFDFRQKDCINNIKWGRITAVQWASPSVPEVRDVPDRADEEGPSGAPSFKNM